MTENHAVGMPAKDADQDGFGVAIKRTTFGHIDYAHYVREARYVRSEAWTGTLTGLGAALVRLIRRTKAIRGGRSHRRPGFPHRRIAGVRRVVP